MYLFDVVSVQCWRYGIRKYLGYLVVWVHICADTFRMRYIPIGARFLIVLWKYLRERLLVGCSQSCEPSTE